MAAKFTGNSGGPLSIVSRDGLIIQVHCGCLLYCGQACSIDTWLRGMDGLCVTGVRSSVGPVDVWGRL